MSAMTNAILSQYPGITGRAPAPVSEVVLTGEVTRETDPKWSATRAAEGRLGIVKRMSVENLPTTVARWLALGRRIDGIYEHR